VQLIAVARPHLCNPQLPGFGVDRGCLHVAVPVRPGLLARVLIADEWVVGRNRAVAVDAHDLAEVAGKVLRRIELEALAEGDDQLAIGTEDEPRTEMLSAADFRLLVEDRFGTL